MIGNYRGMGREREGMALSGRVGSHAGDGVEINHNNDEN